MLEDAGSQELDPDTTTPVVSLISCMVDNRPEGAPRLSGKLKIRIKSDSLAFAAYQQTKVEEAFNCNYELNPAYRQRLEKSGLKVTGVSADGGARIIELPSWFFMATGFLPQYSSEAAKPHPLIVAFLQAALSLKRLKTKGPERPETLEGRWDILYRDYPEVYDEFAAIEEHGKRWIDVARKIVGFRGKIVADIGSGSGKSTFELAEYAKQVIGIEPEDAMRGLAVIKAKGLKLHNVEFEKGWAANIPLEDSSVDMTVTATGAFFYDVESTHQFVREAARITRHGGHIVVVGLAPKWEGGELAPVVFGKARRSGSDDIFHGTLAKEGFAHQDYYSISDFGTVDKAVAVYGFIFGRKAIDYLRAHQKTTVKWKWRIYYKEVSKSGAQAS